MLYYLRQLVDALVHTVETHNLSAEQAPVGRREDHLDCHRQGVGIITGVRRRMYRGGEVINAVGFQPLGGQAGGGYSEVENLRY